jgi:hypothetical protein
MRLYSGVDVPYLHNVDRSKTIVTRTPRAAINLLQNIIITELHLSYVHADTDDPGSEVRQVPPWIIFNYLEALIRIRKHPLPRIILYGVVGRREMEQALQRLHAVQAELLPDA